MRNVLYNLIKGIVCQWTGCFSSKRLNISC